MFEHYRGYLALDILVVAILIFIALPQLDPDMTTTGDRDSSSQLTFLVEWFDETSQNKRQFKLAFFPKDNAVEMYDIKHKRLFLARIFCGTVAEADFYIGNTVVVFSRRLFIKDYGNDSTRSQLESRRESTFAMIKPDGVKFLGDIWSRLEREGFTVARARMTRLTTMQAETFYAEHADRSFFDDLVAYMTSGPVVAMELIGANAQKSWRNLLGPTDCEEARQKSPSSIRALYGLDKTNNAAHGSDSKESVQRELEFFFPTDNRDKQHGPQSVANFQDSTCCVIKPHILKVANAGEILAEIQSRGFNISGLQTFNLKLEHAEEFYEIYKGIVQDYTGMVKQLSSGRSLVLEISHPHSHPALEEENNQKAKSGFACCQLTR